MAMSDSTVVQHIYLAYDPLNSEASARSLIFALNPEWESSSGGVEFERFKDGITNTLFKAIKKRSGSTQKQIDEEAVLLRAYGNGTDVIIDREREARSHSLLARHGLAPSLRAHFDNGLLYSFIQGTPCTPEDFRRPEISSAIAERLGEWHASLSASEAVAGARQKDHQYININQLLSGKPIPNVWTVLQRWIKALPTSSEKARARQQGLQEELESSVKLLGNTSTLSRNHFVLSHTDLLSGNVIIHPQGVDEPNTEKTVSFIDYEYTVPAPQAFDLANHFAEWIGFDCDMNNIPTRLERETFVERYLKSYKATQKHAANGETNGHVNDDDLSRDEEDVRILMDEVDLYRGMSGLYWGTWAIIQSTISSIDFDYTTYAETRLGEYYAWKAEYDGSRKRSGNEMPLRERKWAQER